MHICEGNYNSCTVANTAAGDVNQKSTNNKVIFKTCAPFEWCITEISNSSVDYA